MFGGDVITAKVLIKKDYATTYIYDFTFFSKFKKIIITVYYI